jgi:hypothetical protein
MSSCDIPAPANPANYALNEIILYGLRLNGIGGSTSANIIVSETQSPPETLRLRLDLMRNGAVMAPAEVVIAAVTAYSFEGYCYRFARPKILLFPYGAPDEPAQGCGFELPDFASSAALPDNAYRMWRIRTKTQLVELDTKADFAETLVLEANLPGKRPPATYSLDMEMAHRGGRLSKP